MTEGTLVQYRWDWLQPDALYSLMSEEAKKLTFYYEMAWYVMMPTTAGLRKVEDKGFNIIPLLKSDTVVGEVKKKEARSYRVWNEMESLDYRDKSLKYNQKAGEIAGVGFNIIRIGFIYVLPLLFLGTGVFLWVRRKGR